MTGGVAAVAVGSIGGGGSGVCERRLCAGAAVGGGAVVAVAAVAPVAATIGCQEQHVGQQLTYADRFLHTCSSRQLEEGQSARVMEIKN